jgi:CubicO group peptidase (beta-lactamase class C family)
MAELKVPGVSVAVIDHGQIAWARGYGVLEAGSKRAVTPQTLFQAASISKPVSAMAALSLVQQGKLALDDDVNASLRGWQVPASELSTQEKVTLRRLLNHSAGTGVHGFRGYARGEAVPTLAQLLDGKKPANSAPVRVEVAPGTEFRYSGGGYSIAQLMISQASGKPFAQAMQAQVLGPLGLTHSSFEQPLRRDWAGLAASGHDEQGKPVAGLWHRHPEQAAAGLWTTPSDLAKFAIALQQARAGSANKVLSQATATQMLTAMKGNYGLGVGLNEAGKPASFSHGGSNVGYRAMLFAYTDNGQGAVVMTNGDNGGTLSSEILRAIAAEYGWADYRVTEKTMIKADPALYARYAGQYIVSGMPVTVFADGGRLLVRAAPLGPNPVELFPQSETRFFMLDDDMQLTFEKDSDGAYSTLQIDGNQVHRGRRVDATASPAGIAQAIARFGAQPVYLRGSMNNWGTQNPLRQLDATTYQLDLTLPKGRHEFKIASEDWSTIDFGAALSAKPMLPASSSALLAAGANIVLTTAKAGVVTIALDIKDPFAPVLSITPAR